MEAHGRRSVKETNRGNELSSRKCKRHKDLRKFVSLPPLTHPPTPETNRPSPQLLQDGGVLVGDTVGAGKCSGVVEAVDVVVRQCGVGVECGVVRAVYRVQCSVVREWSVV